MINQRLNPNSALLWLPPILAAGLPVPRTHFIPYQHHELVSIFDGAEVPAEFDRLANEIDAYATSAGGACFIRTDLGSAKHSGPKAFLVKPGLRVTPVLFQLLEDQEMKHWMEPQGPVAIMVREYLTLDATFTAFRDLPINREFRFFASPDKVLCFHPYWPADALEGYVDEARFPNWREQLSELHQIGDKDREQLSQMAVLAASVQCGGAWSVDFARDVNGKYWLIDMARMQDSYHWLGCENRQPGVADV